MEPKKYESLGVDKEKQQSEPTLVEKAQKEEAQAKSEKNTALSTPEQIQKAMEHTTTHHQDIVNGPRENGTSNLESVLTNGNWSEDELKESTTNPSKTTDGEKVEDKK